MTNHLSNLKRETRYGLPAADQILFNRHYVVGYSYHFRQAKWALEIVDRDRTDVTRADNFRKDYRIPDRFSADLEVYEGSGFDRGHLVSSANQQEVELQNSETFLLSNICPQVPQFNRGIWKTLENAVRDLDAKENVLETYVLSGPLFLFDKEVKMLGDNRDDINVTLPIPHCFFKSILTEERSGDLDMYSFIIPNQKTDKNLKDFLVATTKVEKISGLFIWETLVGSTMNKERGTARKRLW